MPLNIELKQAFAGKVVAFNGKTAPLGARTDLDKFLLLSYLSGRADYVAMFTNPPTKQQLIDAGVTLDGSHPSDPPVAVPELTGTAWYLVRNPTVFIAPLTGDKTLAVVSASGKRGSLLVEGGGHSITFQEGSFTQTLQTKATGDTLICYANYAGNIEVWVDNAEGNSNPSGISIGKMSNPQLFDQSQIIVDKYISNTGAVSNAAGWAYVSIPIAYVAGLQDNVTISGQTITLSSQYRFVDANNALLTNGQMSIPIATVAVPANAARLEFSVKRNTNGDGYKSTLMVNYGTSPLPYEVKKQYVNKIDGDEIVATKTIDNGKVVELGDYIKGLAATGGNEVLKIGNLIRIRTSFDATRDLVRQINLFGSQNGASNVLDTRIINKTDAITATGTLLQAISDAVPPPFQVLTRDTSVHMNVGGNHGMASVADVTATAHGKTTADLFSVWTDGSGWEWYIGEIINANTLRLIAKPKNVAGFDKVKPTPASPLNHVSGATNTASFAFTGSAFEYKPAINSVDVKLYIDDALVAADGTYYFKKLVKVVDTHNVADPTQPNLVAPYVPNSNGIMVKNVLVHNFYPNNAYTAENVADWQKNHQLINQGIIQPQVLIKDTYSSVLAYAMNVDVVGGIDFKNGFDISTMPGTVVATKSNFIEPTKAVQNLSQILMAGTTPKIGAGFGYNPLVGLGKQAELLQNAEHLYISDIKKYYPRAYNQRSTNAGVLSGIGFMAYWDATINPKLANDYYIPFGAYDLYFISLREVMTKGKVKLPMALLSRHFEVVNSSAGIVLHTADAANGEGLIVSGAIGDWAILKFI